MTFKLHVAPAQTDETSETADVAKLGYEVLNAKQVRALRVMLDTAGETSKSEIAAARWCLTGFARRIFDALTGFSNEKMPEDLYLRAVLLAFVAALEHPEANNPLGITGEDYQVCLYDNIAIVKDADKPVGFITVPSSNTMNSWNDEEKQIVKGFAKDKLLPANTVIPGVFKLAPMTPEDEEKIQEQARELLKSMLGVLTSR